MVAEHHLAGCHGDINADFEVLRSHCGLAIRLALRICDGVAGTLSQIRTIGRGDALQNLGIGKEGIRGRRHIKKLPRGERNDSLMVRRHARHIASGSAPPLLRQQEALLPKPKWFDLPDVRQEAAIARGGFRQWLRILAGRHLR